MSPILRSLDLPAGLALSGALAPRSWVPVALPRCELVDMPVPVPAVALRPMVEWRYGEPAKVREMDDSGGEEDPEAGEEQPAAPGQRGPYDVSYKLRCKVHALRNEAGWEYKEIAEVYGLQYHTVYKICRIRETPQKRGRCGRPRMIDTPTRKRMAQHSTMDAAHRRMPFKNVAAEVGVFASVPTLRQEFAKEGLHRRVARKKPFLNMTKRLQRIHFATGCQNWTISDWRRVMWTDECYIWIGKNCGQVYVSRRTGEEHLDDCLLPSYSRRSSVMIWGGILGANGKKILVIWERDDWGTIRASTYIDHVLIPAIWPFWYYESVALGEHIILMEDGASPHRAGLTRQWKDHLGIPTLVWPPSSPDLNPIENIWGLLKQRINRRIPQPHTKEALRAAVLDEWDKITVEEIQHYVDTMPRRIQEVLAVDGGHTKW